MERFVKFPVDISYCAIIAIIINNSFMLSRHQYFDEFIGKRL